MVKSSPEHLFITAREFSNYFVCQTLASGAENALGIVQIFDSSDCDILVSRHFIAHEVLEDNADFLIKIFDVVTAEVHAIEKYLAGAQPAHERLAMINLIAELTTRLYGGYQAVLAVHAEGSIEAEKLAMLRAYDPRRALSLATRLAGLGKAGS